MSSPHFPGPDQAMLFTREGFRMQGMAHAARMIDQMWGAEVFLISTSSGECRGAFIGFEYGHVPELRRRWPSMLLLQLGTWGSTLHLGVRNILHLVQVGPARENCTSCQRWIEPDELVTDTDEQYDYKRHFHRKCWEG